jgi:hypothetical protein
MTSTLKADVLTSKTTNGDLSISGDGSGVPDIEASFKVGGTAGVPVSALRAGTDGELITWAADASATTVAVGTATHVLTSNGVGVAPTFQAAAGGGGTTLVARATFSSAATVDITAFDDAVYDAYVIYLSTYDNANLEMLMSYDGGSSFAAAYEYVVTETVRSGPTETHDSSSSSSEILLCEPLTDSIANRLVITMIDPESHGTGNTASLSWEATAGGGGEAIRFVGAAKSNSTGAVDAIRLQPATGTMDGRYAMLGIKRS